MGVLSPRSSSSSATSCVTWDNTPEKTIHLFSHMHSEGVGQSQSRGAPGSQTDTPSGFSGGGAGDSRTAG